MKSFLLSLVLLAAGYVSSYSQQAPEALAHYLQPDGTLNIPPGFSGSFNVQGWKMQTAPDGTPRFMQSTGSVAADSAWDVNFMSGDAKINGDVRAVAVIGTTVYIGGVFTSFIGGSANHIISWNGATWGTLNSGLNGSVYAFAVMGTDLYVGGSFTTPANNIAKWNGNYWSSLGSGTDGDVWALATDGSNVYAAGLFGTAGPVSASRIAKWNGTAWSALGSGTDATVTALACSGTDLYAGGYFSTAGGVTVNQIARWDGTTWDSLGAGLDGSVDAITVDGSDIYIGGSFSMAGNITASNIARWDGAKWDSLGSGVDNVVYSLMRDGSTLYVGGDFGRAGNSAAHEIASWDGSHWSPLGNGMNYAVRALAMVGTDLVAGGYFTIAGSDTATRAALWDGKNWSPLGTGVDGYIYAVAVSGSNVYVGGQFTMAGGIAANNVAKWDGTKWSALGSGIPHLFFVPPPVNSYYISQVHCLVADGSNLYVGGQFDTAGSVRAVSIAEWDGSHWSALGSGFQVSVYPQVPGSVNTIAVSGSDLYAGGSFGWPDSGISKWNGSSWGPVGGAIDGTVNSLTVSDSSLYAGGSFLHAGGVSAKNVARWDGSVWSACGSGTDSAVTGLLIDRNMLYAAGSFTHAGGVPARGIAAWNGIAWSAVGTGISGGFSCASCSPAYWPPVASVLVTDGSFLFSGGMFDSIAETSVNGLAAWDGFTWSPLGSGLARWPSSPGFPYGLPPDVYSCTISAGYLYVGGTFPSAGGKLCNGLARWKIPPPSVMLTAETNAGWNLVSLPVQPSDDSVQSLFPDAASNAYSYTGNYEITATLEPGSGYWIRFAAPETDTLKGSPIATDTVTVSSGWNLIGSLSAALPVNLITSDPPGMVTSKVFGYANGYVVTDTILPGEGYWIKSSASGKLILSTSASTVPEKRIRIMATSGLPPAPPGSEGKPAHFTLYQNYPNPFNPVTEIGYAISEPRSVTLKIFDVLGRLVATLVDGKEAAGFYKVKWDGSAKSSGVYFYRLQAGLSSETRKLLLLK